MKELTSVVVVMVNGLQNKKKQALVVMVNGLQKKKKQACFVRLSKAISVENCSPYLGIE